MELDIDKGEKTMKKMDDLLVKKLWEKFEDVAMNPETETIEEPFYIFPVGTDKETIWHWFDDNYSKGIASLI